MNSRAGGTPASWEGKYKLLLLLLLLLYYYLITRYYNYNMSSKVYKSINTRKNHYDTPAPTPIGSPVACPPLSVPPVPPVRPNKKQRGDARNDLVRNEQHYVDPNEVPAIVYDEIEILGDFDDDYCKLTEDEKATLKSQRLMHIGWCHKDYANLSKYYLLHLERLERFSKNGCITCAN